MKMKTESGYVRVPVEPRPKPDDTIPNAQRTITNLRYRDVFVEHSKSTR